MLMLQLVVRSSSHWEAWLHAASQRPRLSEVLLSSTSTTALVTSIQVWEEERIWSITQEKCWARPGSGSTTYGPLSLAGTQQVALPNCKHNESMLSDRISKQQDRASWCETSHPWSSASSYPPESLPLYRMYLFPSLMNTI